MDIGQGEVGLEIHRDICIGVAEIGKRQGGLDGQGREAVGKQRSKEAPHGIVEQALEVGAAGYVLKGEEPSTLQQAIETVGDGGRYFSEEVENRLVLGDDGLTVRAPGATRAASLTQRELEILRYIAIGMSKKEVAALIDLSVRTVDAHVRNIMDKLDLHDRVELARFAIREGIAPE